MKRSKYPEGFECRMCGKCCQRYGDRLNCTEEDYKLWLSDKSWEFILPHVYIEKSNGIPAEYDIWLDLKDDVLLDECPWLEYNENDGTYYCSIYEVRPSTCRKYPAGKKHAMDTGCPGIKKR